MGSSNHVLSGIFVLHHFFGVGLLAALIDNSLW